MIQSTQCVCVGHRQPVDVCSVSSMARPLRFGFCVMVGFGGQALAVAERLTWIPPTQRHELALITALAQLRYALFLSLISLIVWLSGRERPSNSFPCVSEANAKHTVSMLTYTTSRATALLQASLQNLASHYVLGG